MQPPHFVCNEKNMKLKFMHHLIVFPGHLCMPKITLIILIMSLWYGYFLIQLLLSYVYGESMNELVRDI
jgi:hypothetical protein